MKEVDFSANNKKTKFSLLDIVNKEEYVLPAWRMNEIFKIAAETFFTSDFYEDDFDYTKMIADEGIRIKKYSSFDAENLKKFFKISLSLWDEGVSFSFPILETGERGVIIAYNDNNCSEYEKMLRLLHEYGHVKMKHTQQSINGEMEATFFAAAMFTIIMSEQMFHAGKKFVMQNGKDQLLQAVRSILK